MHPDTDAADASPARGEAFDVGAGHWWKNSGAIRALDKEQGGDFRGRPSIRLSTPLRGVEVMVRTPRSLKRGTSQVHQRSITVRTESLWRVPRDQYCNSRSDIQHPFSR
jgi:hypothetical protein